MNPFEALIDWPARALVRLNLMDDRRATRIVDLSWPRMVTGFARVSQEVADVAMIGIVLGPTALAGMAFGYAYFLIGNQVSLGLSGGTINQVSHAHGANRPDVIDLTVRQGVMVALGMGTLLAVVYLLFTRELVSLLSSDSATIGYGVTYLQMMAIALVFEFVNKIFSRSLVGADDAVTPMIIRGVGGVLNIAFNAVFIFILGLGVFGAGLGTLLATLFVTVVMWAALSFESIGQYFEVPFSLNLGPRYVDRGIIRELLSLSLPLMMRRVAQSLATFPMLAMLSTFGTVVVAGYEVGRRIRRLAAAPVWGFGLAASSLVGQSLGADERDTALDYGWDIIHLTLLVFFATTLFVFVFARPLGSVFVDTPDSLDVMVPIFRAFAISIIGLGLDGCLTGILRGSGDTKWPFYSKFVGLYLFSLPVVYIGTITSVGIWALYIAIVGEMTIVGAILFARFLSKKWL